MSQNQSYFWQTTRHNVYLKRSAKLRMWLALIAVLTYATICAAETSPKMLDDNGAGIPAIFVSNMKLNVPETIAGLTEAPIAAPDIVDDSKVKMGFIDAFTASISVILLTELGDKTFFIAAIMAMRHPRLIVFSGAISALALMTVLSVVFGMAANFIPKVYTYYISTALFAIFGLKMLYEGYTMKPTDAQEELEEVQSDLRKREDELLRKSGRKLSNSEDKEDSSAGADQALIDSTNIIMQTSSKNNNNNINNNSHHNNNNMEMQHRQRKQRSLNLHNNNNIHNNTKRNSCDIVDNDVVANADERRRDSEVFLNKDGSVIAHLKNSINYHSTPMLSANTQQQQQQTNCDNNAQLLKEKITTNAETLVHSVSLGGGGDGGCGGGVGVIVGSVGFINNQTASISNVSAAATVTGAATGAAVTAAAAASAGTIIVVTGDGRNRSPITEIADAGADHLMVTNGELKQRLDRDVNAALVKDPESGVIRKNKRRSAAYLSTRIFVQAFTMTFLAEWGDRSQITTIILAAAKNVYGVIVGGILGHSICTGLAVIGGRMVAAKISVRTVTIVGGIVFIGFAFYSLFMPPDDI